MDAHRRGTSAPARRRRRRPAVHPRRPCVAGEIVLLAEVAAASEAVAVTSGRKAKTELLAACLRDADPAEVRIVAGWLAGQPRQRRTGLGWASLRDLPPPAEQATLTVLEVDRAFDEAAAVAGAGAVQARR